jgi:hypothetical protein
MKASGIVPANGAERFALLVARRWIPPDTPGLATVPVEAIVNRPATHMLPDAAGNSRGPRPRLSLRLE